jgi:hypothetical protein
MSAVYRDSLNEVIKGNLPSLALSLVGMFVITHVSWVS